MCCCGKPIINGQPGYKWRPEHSGVYSLNPPELGEYDTLVYDEPGRCGGVDCHSHHYRVVKRFSQLALLVRHGGGDERIKLHETKSFRDLLASLDSDGRYWLLHTIYYSYHDGRDLARDQTESKWRQAAAEKRIKTRKVRGQGSVKVWIEPKPQGTAT